MIQMGAGNTHGFGYQDPGAVGSSGSQRSPGWNMAQPQDVSPHPSIGSSVNYVQGLQNESRTQTFAQGANEAKTPGGSGLGGILGKAKGLFGGGGAAGEAGAAGEVASVAEVAAV